MFLLLIAVCNITYAHSCPGENCYEINIVQYCPTCSQEQIKQELWVLNELDYRMQTYANISEDKRRIILNSIAEFDSGTLGTENMRREGEVADAKTDKDIWWFSVCLFLVLNSVLLTIIIYKK